MVTGTLVCIGDRYRIGDAEFEVTQPRVTCYRLGLRLDTPTRPALLVAHHRPGFYLRVLTEGVVQAGDPIVRTRRGPIRDTHARRGLRRADPLVLPHRQDSLTAAAKPRRSTTNRPHSEVNEADSWSIGVGRR